MRFMIDKQKKIVKQENINFKAEAKSQRTDGPKYFG